ncbi:SAV_2336 N-terminal domain-related protein [Streptomyces sp. NPDC005209]|uniref:SAV_2336 N-terminal domain-related protein n=1 Tax=Streptomyces sp. NPDC005209 TaxID=3156715 RepID=UPI0033A26526
MPSDPTGFPEPLARLADVLARASGGARPTPRELAEVLWLAGRMRAPADEESRAPVADGASAQDRTPEDVPEKPPATGEETAPTADAPAVRQSPPEPAPSAPPPPSPRVPLHLPTPDARPGAYASLLAPAPPMLRHPLSLQRALRPLKRRIDAPVGHRLDEHATVDRIARLGAGPEWWLPVLRPARERWLRLNLVYDTGPTMPVWRPLIRELHTALAQSGVFRTVDVYRADPDGTVGGPGAHAPTDGRTVTLLISDCMGPQWRQGPAGDAWYGTLRRWAALMPLAVVQPLPEHLWRDTALPAAPGLLSAPFPAAPAAALTFSPYEEGVADGAVPLPVLEPGPGWLANWAGLVASVGGTEFPGSAALLGRPWDTEPRTDVSRLSPEELVLRFRAKASPEAFRLAGHLAVGRPDLPVMRLVQRAVEPDPRPQHLAEVILSGMLSAVPGPPGSYAFRPGVRDLLLRGLPRSSRGRTSELLARMGGLIEDRAGAAPGEFQALTPTPSPTGTAAHDEAFATVTPESMRRLAQAPREHTLNFSLLGAVRVTRDGRALSLEGPEEQALLCMLLLREGESVGRDELAAGVWGELGRGGSRELLDPHLGRLRAVLGADVVVVGDACALRLGRVSGPDDVDVFRVRRLAAEAERVRAGGDLARGRELAETALGLWRGEPLEGVPGPAAREVRVELEALHRRLRDIRDEPDRAAGGSGGDPERLRSTVAFLTDELSGHPEARITLEYAVHEVLSRGALVPRQYEVKVLPNGYLVHVDPTAYLLPVLVAMLRGLPETLAGLPDRPRLRVLLWEAPGAPADLPEPRRPDTGTSVVVSPAVYEEFKASSAAQGSHRFLPMHWAAGDADAPPVAWYCALAPAGQESEAGGLVQGPFITRDLHELGVPAPGRTAVVHTRPDGRLALLNPVQPYGTRPPRPETYYWVDLTPYQDRHTLSLPSSGKGTFSAAANLTWQVDNPVAFVRGDTPQVPELLRGHLVEVATGITRRHPLRHAGAAERAVNAALRTWPVPGLSVTCAVRLAPQGAPVRVPERPAEPRRPAAGVLTDAETVLIGFDGPLARLFSAQTAREAALSLLSVVAENRRPEDALAGRSLTVTGGAGREGLVHPLDVLRALAQDPLGPLVRERLDDIELRAVADAPTTHRSVALVRTLLASGRRVCVVTDVCDRAVRRYLHPYGLRLAGIHGRSENLGLLMPHPDCLRRALDVPGASDHTTVLISSSVAELTAAQQLGLRFVGYATTATTGQRLREAGSEVTVSSLEPLLEAARAH